MLMDECKCVYVTPQDNTYVYKKNALTSRCGRSNLNRY